MLPYYKDPLTQALLGDKKQFQKFKSYFEMQLPGVPTPQDIADFLFKEHTFAEFVEVEQMNYEMYEYLMKCLQNPAVVIEESVASQLILLSGIRASYLIMDLMQRGECLRKIIADDKAGIAIKARALNSVAGCSILAGRFDVAITEFSEAIKLNPQSGPAFFWRGRAYFHLRNYQAAIEDLKRAHKGCPFSKKVLILLGESYVERGKNKQAVAAYLKAYRLVPAGSPEEKAIKDKIVALTKKSTKKPAEPMTVVPQGAINPHAVGWDKKNSATKSVAESDVEMTSALLSLALPHHEVLLTQALAGDRDQYLQFKTYLDSPDAPSLQEVADFLFKKHTFAEFIAASMKYNEISKDVLKWYQNEDFVLEKPVATQLQFTLDIDTAMLTSDSTKICAVCKKIIASEEAGNSLKALAYNYLGCQISYKKRNLYYDKAIELMPQWAEPYNNRGLRYFLRGDYDLARDEYNKAIELDFRNAKYFYNRAKLNAELYTKYHSSEKLHSELLHKASHDFLEASRLAAAGSPLRGTIRDAIIAFMRLSRDTLSSIQLSLQHSVYSGDAQVPSSGNFHFIRGKFDLAEKEYDKAIVFDPNNVNAIRMRGVTRAQKGNREKAVDDFIEAYRLAPAASWQQTQIIVDLAKPYPTTDFKLDEPPTISIISTLPPRVGGYVAPRSSTLLRHPIFSNPVAAEKTKQGQKRKHEELEIDETRSNKPAGSGLDALVNAKDFLDVQIKMEKDEMEIDEEHTNAPAASGLDALGNAIDFKFVKIKEENAEKQNPLVVSDLKQGNSSSLSEKEGMNGPLVKKTKFL